MLAVKIYRKADLKCYRKREKADGYCITFDTFI
jgi:hypothetical protein